MISALRSMGVKMKYTMDGPFFAQRDGNALLKPLGWQLNPAVRPLYDVAGFYLVHLDGHFLALRIQVDGLDLRDMVGKKRTYLHFDSPSDFQNYISSRNASFWHLVQCDGVNTARALQQYEAFCNMPYGMANMEDLYGSSSGVDGWAVANVQDPRPALSSFDRLGGAATENAVPIVVPKLPLAVGVEALGWVCKYLRICFHAGMKTQCNALARGVAFASGCGMTLRDKKISSEDVETRRQSRCQARVQDAEDAATFCGHPAKQDLQSRGCLNR